MKVWCDYKFLAKLPKIGDPQFLDCNRNIVIMTKHPAFKRKFRCSDKLLIKMKSETLHDKCRGLHFTCNPKKGANSKVAGYNVIYIDHLIHGDKKLLSTILHEISHLVDSLLLNSSVKCVDTEVRAYMLQYYTEHVYMMMNFEFPTSSLELRQKEWKTKLDKLKSKLVKKLNLKHTGELYTIATTQQIKNSGVKNLKMFFQTGPRV